MMTKIMNFLTSPVKGILRAMITPKPSKMAIPKTVYSSSMKSNSDCSCLVMIETQEKYIIKSKYTDIHAVIELFLSWTKKGYNGAVDIDCGSCYHFPCRYKCDSVAQLGEHHLDRVGVAGSNPVRVTIHNMMKPLIYKGFLMFIWLL